MDKKFNKIKQSFLLYFLLPLSILLVIIFLIAKFILHINQGLYIFLLSISALCIYSYIRGSIDKGNRTFFVLEFLEKGLGWKYRSAEIEISELQGKGYSDEEFIERFNMEIKKNGYKSSNNT